MVVKLGGSFAYSGTLSGWLDAIAHAAGHVVLVPGGGPFADAVRSAQPKLRFDDAAAHHMALLAMDQFGRALVSLNAKLVLAASMTAIRSALRKGQVPVWSPTKMVLAANDIPASWDVTADSLAAWLAAQIGTQRLLLLKQVEPPSDPVKLADLVAGGIVDRAFADFVGTNPLEVSIAGPALRPDAAAAFARGNAIGARIDLR